jgi:hypothetical protein
MKQKDLALILVVVFVSAVIALLVSRWIFASPKNRSQKVEVVDVIGSDFNPPSTKYFNASSVNPTQQIQIGGSGNPNPFNKSSQ